MKKKHVILFLITILFFTQINYINVYASESKTTAHMAGDICNKYISYEYNFTNNTKPEKVLSDIKEKVKYLDVDIEIPYFFVVENRLIFIQVYITDKNNQIDNRGIYAAVNDGIKGEYYSISAVKVSENIYRSGIISYLSDIKTPDELLLFLKEKIDDESVYLVINKFEKNEDTLNVNIDITDKEGHTAHIYYFEDLKVHEILNNNGWKQLSDGSWNYYDTYGNKIMETWYPVDGKFYYFTKSGAMATGWYQLNGYWYQFGESGAMNKGWYNDNGKWYYLNDVGRMLNNSIIDGRYILDKSGVWIE